MKPNNCLNIINFFKAKHLTEKKFLLVASKVIMETN